MSRITGTNLAGSPRERQRLAFLKAGKTILQVERVEHVGQLILALSQMSPTFVVHRDEHRIREGCGSFQCILAAHGHMETAARLSSAGEQHDNFGRNAAASAM